MAIKSFRDLEIYQLSEDLINVVYDLTTKFPSDEKYVVTSQIRRAVLSVGANIAESYGRYHLKDKINFLYHSRGSLFEVEHFINVSQKLNYVNDNETKGVQRLTKSIAVKLNNYINSIKKAV